MGIEQFFDSIVYARELGADLEKSHPAAYRKSIQNLGVNPGETICIGDNPYTDFWGAKTLGIWVIRLRRGEFKDVNLNGEYEPDFTVTTLSKVPDIMRGI